MNMLARALATTALVLSLPALAAPGDVDALVESVRQEALREAAHDEQRIDEFLAARDEQRAIVAEARRQLAEANKRADALRSEYEENERTLTEYEANLTERSGDLQDTFAIVRQAALSADNILSTSLVSAETPGRSEFLQSLGKAERPPSLDDIRQLWTMVLEEISASGKVVSFPATVISPQGDEVEATVTRAGVFNAVSGGAFLRYLPDAGKLVELSRQPAARYQGMARELESASTGMVAFPLDPSKGAILSLMVQSPDLGERVQQGGSIGYIILALGSIGVLIVLRRALGLFLSGRAIDAQARHNEPNEKNALGRLQKVARESGGDDVEAARVLMDEQLAEEASALNRGLPTVAVLAAVSPLLGLLGTVTGMIETFQSITLFGTGDPKLMSGGISQALVTTQLGLAVAIPLVLFHSVLTGRANRLIEKLGKYSSELIADHESGQAPVAADQAA